MSLCNRTSAVAAVAALLGGLAGGAQAVPAVANPPAQDVTAILAANPGLAASIPIYTAPQEAGKFTSLTVIGDSYADWNNALQYNPVSSQVSATGRYGNALNIIDALQYHYALPTSTVSNYALGGATTGSINNNPPSLNLPGYAQQVQAIVASGRTFTATDLVTITTAGVGGANDIATGITAAQGVANIASYVGTLFGLGARTFLINGEATPGNPALAAASKAALTAALVPYSYLGASIYYFDEAALADAILANPTAYGFAADATATDYCTRFGGTHVCNAGGVNKAQLQTTAQILVQDQYLYFYTHPTSSYAALLAQGDAALLDGAPNVVPEPSSVALLGFGLLGLSVFLRRRG